MSGRVCFLERAGDALAGVRMVGLRTEEAWRPRRAESEDGASVLQDAGAAAAWIAERAVDRTIGFLCVDVDGSNCQWLTSPAEDPVVLAAVMQGAGGGGGGEGGAWSTPDPTDSSIQSLTAIPASVKKRRVLGKRDAESGVEGSAQRLAVLCVPDSMARVTIDALDARGVEVERAGSLWHAMALAWDPGSPLLATGPRVEGEVAAQSPVTAVVLVDPTGRLIWTWSRSGTLLAGGAIMAPVSVEGEVRIGKPEVGRLVADWLAWSVQLGVTPVRTVCVTPKLAGSDLGELELGAAIGRGWSGATVDLAVHADPIGATLGRLAGSETSAPEGTGADLLSLNRRPRRVHRSMFLWGAAAIALGAAGLMAVGVKAWSGASAAGKTVKEVAEETKKLVLGAAPPPQNDAVLTAIAESNPRKYIEERLATEQAKRNVRTGLPRARPILPELENISLVLGTDGIELEEIRLSESLINVHVYVPESKVAEDMVEALGRLGTDHCDWTIKYPTGTKNNLKLIWLDGTWKDKAGGKP